MKQTNTHSFFYQTFVKTPHKRQLLIC